MQELSARAAQTPAHMSALEAILARMTARLPRTVNGTGHTGPSEFCATSI